MTEKTIIKTGEKVYIDTFGGFLKGVYIGIYHSDWFNRDEIVCKVTSKINPCYHYGELITLNYWHVIPRRFYHKTGIFTYRVYPDNYVFEYKLITTPDKKG